MLKTKEETSTVNQLLSRIRTLQDRVNAVNEEKEFYHPETVSSPSVLDNSESQRYAWPRFWIAAFFTELDGYFRECSLKVYVLKKEYLRPYQGLS